MGKIKIKPGDKFGKLTVLERTENQITKGGASVVCWRCKCDCGNVITIRTGNLKRQRNCSKCRGEDLAGKRFGRLLVLEISEKKNGNRRLWRCKCDCGNIVDLSVSRLKHGQKSCGCMREETRKNLGNASKETIKSKEHREMQSAINIKRYHSGKRTANNTSGYTGVSYQKNIGKYFAYINLNSFRYNLGYYPTIEEAAEARKTAENKLHVDFLDWYAAEYPEQWKHIKEQK